MTDDREAEIGEVIAALEQTDECARMHHRALEEVAAAQTRTRAAERAVGVARREENAVIRAIGAAVIGEPDCSLETWGGSAYVISTAALKSRLGREEPEIGPEPGTD